MASSLPSQNCNILKTNNIEIHDQEEDHQKTYKKYKEILPTLPTDKGWMTEHLRQYQGFWLTSMSIKGAMLLQNHFKAKPTDVLLATHVKSGTTWFRALIFATMNRDKFDLSNHPLLTTGPHDCFPFLDYQTHPMTNLDVLPSPRLFATHFPYELLPESAITSGCRFVYICRNPKDVLISKWLFTNKLRPKELSPLSLDEAFDLFCRGVSHYGPFWDHVLGYWKASLESPEKILFLKYEDMKREPLVILKRLAKFLGQPFTLEEESEGVVQEIIRLCGFESLSNLEVNKTAVKRFSDELSVENREFFRKGQVGDWKNHLTIEMTERLDRITEEKCYGSGLTFGVSSPS